MLKTGIFALVTAASLALPAAAATVVAFNTIDNVDTIAASITGGDAVGQDFEHGDRLGLYSDKEKGNGSTGWLVGGDKDTALAEGSFVTFGFSSAIGVDLDALTIRFRSNKSLKSLALDAVIDGVLHEDLYTLSDLVFRETQRVRIELDAFQDVNSAQFILSGWDAKIENGVFFFFDRNNGDAAISVTGDFNQPRVAATVVGVVPVPASLPFLLAGIGMLGLARRRKG